MHPASKPPADTTTAPRRTETTGLVLAGGAGRRVQGRDKGLILWRGEPLVAYAAGSLRPLVRELLISCNRHPDRYAPMADRVVADDRAGYQGPLAGLEAARDLIATPLLLVAPCDMPGVPAVVFEQLLKTLTAPQGARRDAVFLHSGGRDYYLCLAMRSDALAGLATYLDGGDRSVRGWLATLDTQTVTVTLPDEQLRNINALPGD
ncbi:MAG: molybdenum cofactor guanylyltransferase MobA [Chromatocurvus sp.]